MQSLVAPSAEGWAMGWTWVPLCADVKCVWQPLVFDLQTVDVTQLQFRNAQHVRGSHLLHFAFPVRGLDPRQLRALNCKQNPLSEGGNIWKICTYMYSAAKKSLHPDVRILQRWWQCCPPRASARSPSGKIINRRKALVYRANKNGNMTPKLFCQKKHWLTRMLLFNIIISPWLTLNLFSTLCHSARLKAVILMWSCKQALCVCVWQAHLLLHFFSLTPSASWGHLWSQWSPFHHRSCLNLSCQLQPGSLTSPPCIGGPSSSFSPQKYRNTK